MRAPINSHTAAKAIPCPAVNTLVATTVAIELAASWNPLMSSNTNATITTTRTKRTAPVMLRGLGMFENDMENDIAGVAAAVEDLLDQFVEIFQDDDVDSTEIAVVKAAQRFDHQFVGFAFNMLEGVV